MVRARGEGEGESFYMVKKISNFFFGAFVFV